jgi:hypothetical protein
LSKCAGDLIDWFSYNWVKLNPQKSEVLYFAPSELANRLITLLLRVVVNLLEHITSARVLGVQLTMDRQISAIVRAANFNLYRLGKVRGHLITEATKILVHSYLITHLDYANSLLASLSQKKLRPIQSVQDSASHLIYRVAISTEVFRFRLHWLPINFSVLFKILLLVFDCLQGTALVYLRKCWNVQIYSEMGLPSSVARSHYFCV